MRICISQLNPTIGAFTENSRRIIEEIEQAKQEAATLIIFPELALCGYPPEDLLDEPGFIEAVENTLITIIPHTKTITAIIGLPRKTSSSPSSSPQGKSFYNSVAVISDGKLLGFQDKILLPTYDVFDERRYFQPGAKEQIWVISEKKVAITICEDIWPPLSPQTSYPNDPIAFYAKQHIDLLINCSASPYSFGKITLRNNEVLQKIAQRCNCTVILCNQVGAQDGLIFDGTSSVYSSTGELLLQAKSFAEDHLLFDLKHLPSPPQITKKEDPAQELFTALAFGLKDYFQKQGFYKACLGLSGGIDSAVVACIAVKALGKENILGALLPSRFTSEQSRTDALHLAKLLGISTTEIPIDPLFTSTLQALQPSFQGQASDTTEENIQARLRGILLMALSNKQGYLLLNTSNKSELALGYSTLYGDSCGAIAVIGDLLKSQVYLLGKWIQKHLGQMPESILQRAPTAELRHNQKDSDSIPEYHLLDPILEDVLTYRYSAQEIASRHSVSLAFVKDIIYKIHASEYKRRQCPFALRVSEKSFSMGRRIPIVHKFE